MKKFEGMFSGLGIILLLSIVFLIGWRLDTSDKNYMDDWAKQNEVVVEKIDRQILDHGPFWFSDEDDRIYKLKATNGKVVWFRFNIFSTDIEEEKTTN